MQSDEMKRKLRQLRRLEEKIRFGGNAPPAAKLVWRSFFDTRDVPQGRVRYPLDALTAMGKEAYRAVIDEYFAYVYYELYRENDAIILQGCFDPEILQKLGLPRDAGIHDIKRRFRALAKLYHPDTGGDAARFIELMAAYRQLTEK